MNKNILTGNAGQKKHEMTNAEKEKIVLFVIEKYGRPISIQPLHRGIRVQIIENGLDDFGCIPVVRRLLSKGRINCINGFYAAKPFSK